MDNQQIRDGIVRVMRKRKITVKEISAEIPCHFATLTKFLKNNGPLTNNTMMMIEQWVNDNLKDNS